MKQMRKARNWNTLKFHRPVNGIRQLTVRQILEVAVLTSATLGNHTGNYLTVKCGPSVSLTGEYGQRKYK